MNKWEAILMIVLLVAGTVLGGSLFSITDRNDYDALVGSDPWVLRTATGEERGCINDPCYNDGLGRNPHSYADCSVIRYPVIPGTGDICKYPYQVTCSFDNVGPTEAASRNISSGQYGYSGGYVNLEAYKLRLQQRGIAYECKPFIQVAGRVCVNNACPPPDFVSMDKLSSEENPVVTLNDGREVTVTSVDTVIDVDEEIVSELVVVTTDAQGEQLVYTGEDIVTTGDYKKPSWVGRMFSWLGEHFVMVWS